MTKGRIKRFLLVLDCGLNVLLGGWNDEWVSTRAHRMQHRSRIWAAVRKGIDAVFSVFGQEQHCLWSYVSDQMYRHIPPEQRL